MRYQKYIKIGREILLHLCVVCSLVGFTVNILDWYNPYMDFSGRTILVRYVLYICVFLLCAVEFFPVSGGEKTRQNKEVVKDEQKRGCDSCL